MGGPSYYGGVEAEEKSTQCANDGGLEQIRLKIHRILRSRRWGRSLGAYRPLQRRGRQGRLKRCRVPPPPPPPSQKKHQTTKKKKGEVEEEKQKRKKKGKKRKEKEKKKEQEIKKGRERGR